MGVTVQGKFSYGDCSYSVADIFYLASNKPKKAAKKKNKATPSAIEPLGL